MRHVIFPVLASQFLQEPIGSSSLRAASLLKTTKLDNQSVFSHAWYVHSITDTMQSTYQMQDNGMFQFPLRCPSELKVNFKTHLRYSLRWSLYFKLSKKK